MKVLVVLLTLILMLSCSLSHEDKAKQLINMELKETLHDYKSYESVKFGKLDSSFTDFYEEPNILELMTRSKELTSQVESDLSSAKIYRESIYLQAEFQKYFKKAKEENKELGIVLKTIDSLKTLYHPKFNGWKIDHSYRAKALNGNLGIHHYTFYFDSALIKINKQVDIGKKEIDDDK